jgi:hypothetical protein
MDRYTGCWISEKEITRICRRFLTAILIPSVTYDKWGAVLWAVGTFGSKCRKRLPASGASVESLVVIRNECSAPRLRSAKGIGVWASCHA